MKINNLVALYGTTNVGKSTQIEFMSTRCISERKKLWTQKYPIYNLAPTGPLIFEAIKQGNPKGLSAGEIQALMAKNRFDFQPELLNLCEGYDLVVTEMYTGTGIAYGVGDGVSKDVLIAINEGLVIPGINILLDGNRFLESIEKGHRFEEDSEKTNTIRQIHLDLAKHHVWHIVNANQEKQQVHEEVWAIVSKVFSCM